MKICPHCKVSFDETKQYIFCPNCRRTPNTIEGCAEAVLQCVDTQELHREASEKYWKTIVRGMNRVIMDGETSIEVANMLFHTPLEASSDLLNP